MSTRCWILVLAVLSLALGLADFTYDKHGYFEFEQVIGFHGIFALVFGAVAALVATIARKLLTRDADYYGSRSVDTEDHPVADLGRENADA